MKNFERPTVTFTKSTVDAGVADLQLHLCAINLLARKYHQQRSPDVATNIPPKQLLTSKQKILSIPIIVYCSLHGILTADPLYPHMPILPDRHFQDPPSRRQSRLIKTRIVARRPSAIPCISRVWTLPGDVQTKFIGNFRKHLKVILPFLFLSKSIIINGKGADHFGFNKAVNNVKHAHVLFFDKEFNNNDRA